MFLLNNQIQGGLLVRSPLDRESQDLYTLVLQARDNSARSYNAKQLTDSLTIKIHILDVNDNSPQCENEHYWVTINQNADIHTTLIEVKASDIDLGMNSKLSYALAATANKTSGSENLFEIDKLTGRIRTKQKLFGFSGVFLYNVSVRDGGEVERVGYCSLKVMVKDFNAHAPIFTFPNENNSSIRIRSDLEKGAHLLWVKAFDPDAANATDQVVYSIDEKRTLNNDWKGFSLDPLTGELKLNAKLSINRQSVYLVSYLFLKIKSRIGEGI